ncbi:MAG TPA: CvpA family protein [Terracidiphilus sp.]|nr:CvpA family protein [Terracidiphilus sp.]
MNWVDCAVVIVLVIAVMAGLIEGFFRSVSSLAGLVLGLSVAAWNYGHVAAILKPLVRVQAVANAAAFLLIAILIMAVISIIGSILARTFRLLGLGWLDSLAGAAFGLLQGAVLITLLILVTVAFFPGAEWLTAGRLPQLFFSTCNLSTHMTPAELAARVRDGLRTLEHVSPHWMHPS